MTARSAPLANSAQLLIFHPLTAQPVPTQRNQEWQAAQFAQLVTSALETVRQRDALVVLMLRMRVVQSAQSVQKELHAQTRLSLQLHARLENMLQRVHSTALRAQLASSVTQIEAHPLVVLTKEARETIQALHHTLKKAGVGARFAQSVENVLTQL